MLFPRHRTVGKCHCDETFERVRDWKLSILSITHEEMMHLHYVQCLLRALVEPADFTLPERSAGSGDWHFEGWRARVGALAKEVKTF